MHYIRNNTVLTGTKHTAMRFIYKLFHITLVIAAIGGVTTAMGQGLKIKNQSHKAPDYISIAKLDKEGSQDFKTLRKAFRSQNPGYDLEYFQQTKRIDPMPVERILFLQQGSGTATISTGESSRVSVGDIVLLHKREVWTTDSLIDMLAFEVPEKPDQSVPRFIRPDWDPNITDAPGGCASDTGAYRRILLTWESDVGPYQYHALNAHRVRITNSFTHYHPQESGFEEFYLVQRARPGAKLITSNQLDLIRNYDKLSRKHLSGLLQETPLKEGDLVYIPRGIVHRGYGGALVQVITVPGFVPGKEYGVDHFIHKINQKFKLTGTDTLPYYHKAIEQERYDDDKQQAATY